MSAGGGESLGRLRVCHMIAGDQWAGAEVQVAHLLSGLAQYKELELSAILFAEGCLADELRQSGISVTVVDEGKLGRLGLVRGIKRILCTRPVHILHTHRYKENILGALAGRWARIPWFVRTEHGRGEPFQGIDHFKMALYARADHLLARLATDRVIAVSHDLYRDLVSRLPQRRVALIRNGINSDRVKTTVSPRVLRQQLGIAMDAPVFGTAGRLVPVKGLDYFLQAAQGIFEKLRESRFIIVGEGPLQSGLEQQTRELGLESAVRFLGFRRDVLDVLNLMDVFVMPSVHEGLPMVLLEAMILGKPIVASATGGIPEVLNDLRGWLVPPGDVQAMKEACIQAFGAVRNGAKSAVLKNRLAEIEQLASTMCSQTRALYHQLASRDGREGWLT